MDPDAGLPPPEHVHRELWEGHCPVAVVGWRHLRRDPRPPSNRSFVAVGAASGLGSALLGSAGPLTAPFFLARDLRRSAYIGTEAACALALHLTKTAAYGPADLIDARVLALGVALTPATLAGTWTGRKITGRGSDRAFGVVVEIGFVAARTDLRTRRLSDPASQRARQ